MRKGKFIVIEGLDYSGKSTQRELLAEKLKSFGIPHVATFEPTKQSEAGIRLRRILNKQEPALEPLERQKLFVADRAWHVENVIMPGVAEGKLVVSDRYFFSTIAYGSIDVDPELMVELNSAFPVPDATFILDVPVEVCLERLRESGHPGELFEREDFLRKADATYRSFARRYRNIVSIDGTQKPEEVSRQISTAVLALLGKEARESETPAAA